MVKKGSIFWDITLYISLKVNRRFGKRVSILRVEGAKQDTRMKTVTNSDLLATFFMLFSCFGLLFNPKYEATCSSETSVFSTDYMLLYPGREKHSFPIFVF
jgi:hypothetical protein